MSFKLDKGNKIAFGMTDGVHPHLVSEYIWAYTRERWDGRYDIKTYGTYSSLVGVSMWII